jgi:hypothetical protein
VAGFGIWWIAHWPVTLSPMTIAGAPNVSFLR